MTLDKETIKYFRTVSGEEIIAYTQEEGDNYILHKPVEMYIATYYEEGTQLMNFKEYIPPSVVKVDHITMPKDMIILCLETNDDFKQQYIDMCDTLYTVQRSKSKKKNESSGGEEKVLSLIEALLEKKNKPTH